MRQLEPDEEEKMRLNLGCGADIKRGWINIDREDVPGVDLILNLEEGLLPYYDNSVQEIYCAHVLEHLWEWEKLVLEVYRVLKPGGRFEVRVPYGFRPRAYHVRSFLPWTMDAFIIGAHMDPDSSFEKMDRFVCEKRTVSRIFPFRYHIKKYLKLDMPVEFPIGPRHLITWILRKPGGNV